MKSRSGSVKFDLRSVSFSTAGACMNIRITPAWKERKEGLYLRLVPSFDLMRLTVSRGGRPVPWDHVAGARSVTLKPRQGSGRIDFAFETPTSLRIRALGLSLCMEVPGSAFTYALRRGEQAWQINQFGAKVNLLLSTLRGEVKMDAPWTGVRAEHLKVTVCGEKGPSEVVLEEFTTTAPSGQRRRVAFGECMRRTGRGFGTFMDRLPEVPVRYSAARELAGYILWSAVVAPRGHYRRPAILMSKNNMTMVWSWDHCFNAMALASGHPDLAWDQMLVMFDHQDEHGAIPDAISTDSIIWNFSKPPVHGWALLHMLRNAKGAIGRRQLAEFYPQLERWTEWWLRTRDDDRDGICQYNHGNDSGWDNATCFASGLPIEGPDLAAFLVTQMDALSKIADRIGRPVEARRWNSRADRMLRTMILHSWIGDRFVAAQSGTHSVSGKGDSLIPFAPLILGRRLPPDISRVLVDGLSQPDRFLTKRGLATESPKSSLYEPDGYWRGPVWAPSTYIIYDGLLQLGENKLAREVARRFCDTCRMSGMAENFDALTGAPLRDKAYTWTASVFLLLAHDLSKK